MTDAQRDRLNVCSVLIALLSFLLAVISEFPWWIGGSQSVDLKSTLVSSEQGIPPKWDLFGSLQLPLIVRVAIFILVFSAISNAVSIASTGPLDQKRTKPLLLSIASQFFVGAVGGWIVSSVYLLLFVNSDIHLDRPLFNEFHMTLFVLGPLLLAVCIFELYGDYKIKLKSLFGDDQAALLRRRPDFSFAFFFTGAGYSLSLWNESYSLGFWN